MATDAEWRKALCGYLGLTDDPEATPDGYAELLGNMLIDEYRDGWDQGYTEGNRHGHARAERGESLPDVFKEENNPKDIVGRPKHSRLYREERDEAREYAEAHRSYVIEEGDELYDFPWEKETA